MTKPVKAWAVFTPRGVPFLITVSSTRALAIANYRRSLSAILASWEIMEWSEYHRLGYTCRRVEIREVKPKGKR